MAKYKLLKSVAKTIDKVKGEDAMLKLVSPLPDIEKYNRIMFVGPHPDDIEIGAGATINKMVKAGKDIFMLICTDGGSGVNDDKITPKDIADIRWKESQDSAKVLGVTKLECLNFEDGGFYTEWDLAKEIAKKILEFRPEVVICPDPNLPTETHPDHLKCGRATCDALWMAEFYHVAKRNGIEADKDKMVCINALAYYFTNRANTFVVISKEDENTREKAISKHVSQMKGVNGMGIYLYLTLRDKHMGEKCGEDLAEGFFVMSNLHRHCVSESSNL